VAPEWGHTKAGIIGWKALLTLAGGEWFQASVHGAEVNFP
jgi:hypothetical protein